MASEPLVRSQPATLDPPKPSAAARLLAPYRRITSSGQFIPEIDGFRFIAIFSVFLYHLAGDVLRHSPPEYAKAMESDWLFKLTQQLNIGVPLFFVISGFILGLPFATRVERHKSLSLKRYYWRRVTRLEPPYVVSMLLFFTLKVVGGRGSALALLAPLGASLLYIHNQVYGVPSAINVVAWSLEIEIQFYIVAPALAMIFRAGPKVRRISLLLACAGLSAFSYWLKDDVRVQLSLLGHLRYFIAGFLLIDLYLARPAAHLPARIPAWMWDLGSALGWGLLFGGLLVAPDAVVVLMPIGVPFLYYAAFRGFLVNRVFTNPWLTTLGGMCYSVYLLHNYAISLLGFKTEGIGAGLPFELRLPLQLVLISPGVILISAVYFRFIERPCMRPDWPQRLMRRLRG